MKSCSTCKVEQPVEAFAYKVKATGKRSSICRACQKAYTKKHYAENAELYKARARVTNPQTRARARQWVTEYLLAHPCVDCGETDIDVLEFDHIELVGPNHPRVSHLQNIGKIKREIALCEVRCCNCHARRTRRQLGTSRLRHLA